MSRLSKRLMEPYLIQEAVLVAVRWGLAGQKLHEAKHGGMVYAWLWLRWLGGDCCTGQRLVNQSHGS